MLISEVSKHGRKAIEGDIKNHVFVFHVILQLLQLKVNILRAPKQ